MLVVLLVVGGLAFLSSQSSVDVAVRELVLRSEGRLEVENATGSLLDTIHIDRLVWRGPGANAQATDVTLTWSPAALSSRRLVIRRFEARALTFDLVESDTPAQLPVTLQLPMEVSLERVSVARLEWHVGKNTNAIRDIEFSYAGGAVEHRFSNVSLISQFGAVSGDAMIGANAPYPIGGTLQFDGADALRAVNGSVRLSGALAEIGIEGTGRVGEASVAVRTSLTPLAPVLLRGFDVDANDVDIAQFNAALPATRIALSMHAQLADGGLTGTAEATNALAGSVDAKRVPVRAMSARFAWRPDSLALDDISAELHGGGRASGQARIPLADPGAAGRWTLAVRDLNLRGVYASLRTTRLSGTVSADLDDLKKARVSGDIRERDIAGGVALDFAAVVADDAVDVERFRARTGPGELEGRGRIEFRGNRAFQISATARRFNPSRLGDFPEGHLEGTIAGTGALMPAWHVDVSIVVASGSRLAGYPLSGKARGGVSPNAIQDAAIDMQIGPAKLVATGNATRSEIRNAVVDLQVGSAKLNANGSVGKADDRIVLKLDAPKLAELATYFPKYVPANLAGAVHVDAQLRGLMPQAGIDAEIKAEGLKLGPAFAARTLNARVAVAPGRAGATGHDFAERSIALELNAAQIVAPAGTFANARADVKGTLAQHSASIAFKGEDLDVDATAHGGLSDVRRIDLAGLAWSGSLDTLENRGPWPLKLASPATLSVSRTLVRIGDTQVAIADGNVHLAEFAWQEGKITTRGDFKAVPMASAARFAGIKLPFVTTLKLGGDWSVAATPRLSGTVRLQREDGDIWLRGDPSTDAKEVPLGVTSIALNARFVNDAVEASGTFRSARGGNADMKGALGAVPNAPAGHLAPNAPLTLAVDAELPTLQLLQPWIGTVALIDGRARLNIAGKGTLDRPTFTGTVNGDSLRIDAPQYGLSFHDGRLAAHVEEKRVVLDELVLLGGEGRFVASGTIASAAGAAAEPQARLTWRAEKFRLFNRPDMRLVVDGEGTVTTGNGKLALAGQLKAREGRFVYEQEPDVTLGEDVVVKGWAAPSKQAFRAGDLPLSIDLALDFGDNLTFSGEGLEANLRGVVRVATAPGGGFTGKGSIRAVNGTYFAFGQKLVIDRGRLIFDGPLDNPGLDIVALRKNLAVEAGVAVTGTIKVPVIQLTSNPPMPEGEKLSWLVLGQGLDRSSGADVAALQAASAVLFGRNSKPISTRIAQSIGLDDISIKSTNGAARSASGTRGTADAQGQVVAVGKRLSDRLSLVYEQGLTVATNALRLEYSVSRTLTLRAEAGTVSGVGIYYRKSFE